MISVVMPVYNGERFLAQAVDSILAQTLRKAGRSQGAAGPMAARTSDPQRASGAISRGR